MSERCVRCGEMIPEGRQVCPSCEKGERKMAELKPCPFCGGTDIRYSLKITGHFDVRYHAAMYCNKCHCYGARTLTGNVRHDNYKGRTEIEKNEGIKAEAIEAWNRRAEDGK